MENNEENYLNGISKLDYQREFANIKNDLAITKKNLKAKKKALIALKEEAEVTKYLELLTNPKVVKYLSVNEEIAKLEYEEFGLEKKFELLSQLMCKHPALLVTQEIAYDLGTYATCKCLECKKIIDTKEKAVDPEALIYIKPRSNFYFITEEEVKKVEETYKTLKENKKCSPRRLVKKFNNK